MNALRRHALAVSAVTIASLALLAATASAATPTSLLRYFGDTSSATGAALGQGSCDVNDDGYDDTIVGAWFWDKAPTNNIGAAYVLFGGPGVHGGDLNVPSGAGAARIDGPGVANSFVGFAVACLGDVNGDGIDDLGISHYTAEKIYVVLGAEEFGSVDLGVLGDRGYEVRGDATDTLDYNVGFSMSGVGDVNDDGLDDYAVAGVVADTLGRTNNGRVWIVAGKEGVANVDLINPSPGQVLLTVDGRGNEDRLGSAAPAGDVNGDDVDDIVLGAYTSTPWGPSVAVPGEAWVVWGGQTGSVDLASVGTSGFAIYGPKRQRDRLGISVSGAGDVNGDDLDDVIVGGDGVYNAATGQRPGSAWVVFGKASGQSVYTDTSGGATPAVYSCAGTDPGTGTCTDPADAQARGYWIQGADSDPGTGSEGTGYSLSGIGDVNADGIPDFAIGAYGYDPVNPANPAATMSGAGAVWVVHGKTATTTQALTGLPAADGYRIDGLAAGDRFGRQVASLGDIDGNGISDFAGAGDFAGRPLAPGTPRTQAGEVVVALQGALRTGTALAASSAGPLAPGEEFDLTATVATLPAPGGGPSGGTVAFTDGDTPIPGCDAVPVDPPTGEAVCEGISFPEHGVHSLAAGYSGEADRKPSASEALSRVVVEGSATSIQSSANPVLKGAPVTFTAAVSGEESDVPATGGTVTVSADGTPLPGCSDLPLDSQGEANCTATFADAGTRSVTAGYSGAVDLEASVSAALPQVITSPQVIDPPPAVPASATLGAAAQRPSGAATFTLASVVCGSTPCAVAGRVSRVGIGQKHFPVTVLGTGPLAAGQTQTVRITIGPAARKALRARGRGRLGLNLEVGSESGSVSRDGKFLLRPATPARHARG